MTQKEFEEKKFLFDREFTKGSQQIKRLLDHKYEASLNLGFRSAAAREQHAVQLEAAKEAELETRLKALWEDLEADLFGSKGMDGTGQSLQSSITIIGVPAATHFELLETSVK